VWEKRIVGAQCHGGHEGGFSTIPNSYRDPLQTLSGKFVNCLCKMPDIKAFQFFWRVQLLFQIITFVKSYLTINSHFIQITKFEKGVMNMAT
jgi:hypothetical protein